LLQIKLITTEAEQAKEANKTLQATIDDKETHLKLFEKNLKEKNWECKDLESMKDAK
jgi:hypothetical protein